MLHLLAYICLYPVLYPLYPVIFSWIRRCSLGSVNLNPAVPNRMKLSGITQIPAHSLIISCNIIYSSFLLSTL